MTECSNATDREIAISNLAGTATIAKLLGVDKATVTRRVASGKLTAVAKLDGHAFVFDRAEVEALAKEAAK